MLRSHHLCWHWHHWTHCWLNMWWEHIGLDTGFLLDVHWFVIVRVVVMLLLLLIENMFIHFSDIIFLSIIHFLEIIKYPSFNRSFLINFKHFMCSLRVKIITIFWLNNLLIIHIVQPIKMFIIHIFNVNPFNKEESLEL